MTDNTVTDSTATEATLERMIALFDVTPLCPDRFVGAGMAYVRGQVLTADGRLLASFTQDAMIRALAGPAASVPSASRL